MKFILKKFYDGAPYLESTNRIFSIVFSEESFEYQCAFSDTGDTQTSSPDFEELLKVTAKKLFEKIEISQRDMKLFKSFYESIRTIQARKFHEETKIIDPKAFKRYAKLEKGYGGSAKFNASAMTLSVKRADGKVFNLKGKEVEKLIDEFSSNPASEDQTLEFEDYILVVSQGW